MDWSWLQPALILFLGTGVFLRLVAKEKRRREKHLESRLDEQIHKLREEKERAERQARQAALAEAERSRAGAEMAIAEPVDPR